MGVLKPVDKWGLFMLHFLFLSLNLRDESNCYTDNSNLVPCASLVPKCLMLVQSCVFSCILNSQMDYCSSSKIINSQTFHINLLFFSLRTSNFTLKSKFGISVTVLQWFTIRKQRCKTLLYNCVLACWYLRVFLIYLWGTWIYCQVCQFLLMMSESLLWDYMLVWSQLPLHNNLWYIEWMKMINIYTIGEAIPKIGFPCQTHKSNTLLENLKVLPDSVMLVTLPYWSGLSAFYLTHEKRSVHWMKNGHNTLLLETHR